MLKVSGAEKSHALSWMSAGFHIYGAYDLAASTLNRKIFDPAKQDSKCDECAGDDPRKGQPVIGMTILTGLKPNGDNVYGGGTILDPANGKTYNAKVTVIEGGRKLEMRGSILFIGRTQTWVRAE